MARTVGQMVAEATEAVPAVTAEDVRRRMQEDPNTLVIDVRDSADARDQHPRRDQHRLWQPALRGGQRRPRGVARPAAA